MVEKADWDDRGEPSDANRKENAGTSSTTDESAYCPPFSDSNDSSYESKEEDDQYYADIDEEMAGVLQSQLDQLTRENEWNEEGISAVSDEMTTFDPPMDEYQWACFMYEWRRKFGKWGKRTLDIHSCLDEDRVKAARLLMEIDRRRSALASCKAHIMKLMDATGQGQADISNKGDAVE